MTRPNGSRRRRILVALALLGGAIALAALIEGRAARNDGAASVDGSGEVWTCSMHPQVRTSEPGSCPICAMPLVRATPVATAAPTTPATPVSPGDEHAEHRTSGMALSADQRVRASVESVAVRRMALSREIRAVGKVQYNESTLANITTRVEGYVENLFVDYTGVEVNRGDHLVEIYSPELLVAQQELLVALDGSGRDGLVESARRKLVLWGLTATQVDELVRERKISDRITLFSPITGTVVEKLIVRNAMVKPGELLYRLANLESVWVYLDVYEYELSWIQYGQMVEITSEALPGTVFGGRVWFISPVVDESTRTVKVLLNINNDARKLKPGMYVSAVIRADLRADGQPAPTGLGGQWTCPMHPLVVQHDPGSCPICGMRLVQIPGEPQAAASTADRGVLAVPVSAVLDTGTRKLVYVESEQGVFSPVEVETGPRTADYYPILAGLEEGDRVAARGAFLLDSQFQIQGLPSLFHPEGDAPATGHLHGDPAPREPTPEPEASAVPPERHDH